MQPRTGGSRGPLNANTLLLILLGGSVVLLIALQLRKAVHPPPGSAADLQSGGQPLYFEAGDATLGFAVRQMSLATAEQILLIEFVDAKGVAPEIVQPADETTPAAQTRSGAAFEPLEEVRYPNLWPGISLACSCGPGGKIRHTYTLEPGADPGRIRLHYSAPVTLGPDGRLTLHLPAGALVETKPAAWQHSGDERVSIPAAYVVEQTREGQEVRLSLGAYDPRYPLTIWHMLARAEGPVKGER